MIKMQDPSGKFNADNNISLEQFIYLYINGINTTMSKMLSLSVVNIYKGYFSLYMQASRIYPNFAVIMTQNSVEEINLWEKVINHAIQIQRNTGGKYQALCHSFPELFLGACL